MIKELAASGLGIVMVSSELTEILTVSDRVLVLSEGQLTGNFIGVLNNGLVLLHVSPFWQQVVKGTVILLAVIIDKANSKE